ncbi:hypothetical protein BG53_02180 [Paenibacillus darwinianus]|uniref:UPF0637 protein BG53_02180 n=1 Tax=Paenibacillus darwinianus TaxID=1380763 RepID=A0A9W5S0T2_9BACL|nr:DUF1054 domain-containing protein [Paenibacillus darwinianus]EXX85565.1 hypothetical protein BG52_08135 [Paenibacillus darwinianus]EXX88303.1 hypothetical protein BG53_02180 [Paenibacillus darwinianus]EXX89836.1 hypothetical protein CH50_00695 [Paenibacillus darwinianus]
MTIDLQSGTRAGRQPAELPFPGFGPEDFDVFAVPGLEGRMSALIERVRPKLAMLGERLTPYLTVRCGEEMFPHVAKHARRTINAPNDTWVAFANNKRGYKAHPHFQIGMFGTHLFVLFAVIYESTNKDVLARNGLKKLNEIRTTIPNHFVWSGDHMQPEATRHDAMKKADLEALFKRLQTVKASELLCGIHIDRNDPIAADGEAFIAKAEETFDTLMPLYRMAF